MTNPQEPESPTADTAAKTRAHAKLMCGDTELQSVDTEASVESRPGFMPHRASVESAAGTDAANSVAFSTKDHAESPGALSTRASSRSPLISASLSTSTRRSVSGMSSAGRSRRRSSSSRGSLRGEGVKIWCRSKEWGDFGDSSSSSSDEDVPNVCDRQQRYARIAQQMQAEEESKEEEQGDQAGRSREERANGLRKCFVSALFFVAFNSINACVMRCMLVPHGGQLVALCLLPPWTFVVAVQVCLAWTDRDVAPLRIRLQQQSPYFMSLLFQAFVVIVLALFSGYQLMEAYTHFRGTSKHRSFLAELEGMEPPRQALVGVLRWENWEFLWAPPMVVTSICLLAGGSLTGADWLLWVFMLALSGALMVAGAVEYDFKASTCVRTEYGMLFDHDTSAWRRSAASRERTHFAMAHYACRASELAVKILALAALAVALHRYPCCLGILVLADYSVGFAILRASSNSLLDVALMSVPSVFLDLGCFIDEPGFCQPARQVSKSFRLLRAAELALAALAAWQAREGLAFSSALFTSACIACGTWFASQRACKVGELPGDIFTALMRADVGAVEASLDRSGGCKVNMKICNGSGQTPLHVAVAQGQAGCVEFLLREGADCNAFDANRENPLHIGCRSGNVDVVRMLLSDPSSNLQPQSLRQLNTWGESPDDVLKDGGPPELAALLAEEQAKHFGLHGKVRSPKRAITAAAEKGAAHRKSWRQSIFGSIIGGELFHVKAGPRDNVRHTELACFLFSRSMGEQGGRLLEHFRRTESKVCLSYLFTECTLGAGSFGKVLKLKDMRTGESYAMKIQRKDKAAKQAIREAHALHANRHPFIVGLEDIFHTPVFYCILMEYCAKDLNVRIIEHAAGQELVGGIPKASAARYATCIMLALEHLHERTILFRDLKPENVLITSEERGNYAKLADFGLARQINVDGDKSQEVGERRMTIKAGTLAFMPGEAIEGDGDDPEANMTWYAGRDWYGLGCCLLLMLLGERGGRKVSHGKRQVLLPAPQPDVLDLLLGAMDDDLIGEEEFDLVTSLTSAQASDRANSATLRESPFLKDAIEDLGSLL